MKKRTTDKKTAVVTGASSGIGKEIAANLTEKGYTVVNVSRRESENTDFFPCDLSDPVQTENTAKQIIQKYGKIDLIVNNAGLGISGATELLPQESVRHVMEVDYFAPLLFTRALLPAVPAGGKIVMISSACALFALPYRGVYCSAKAALNMLSFGLRMELKHNQIDVVSVCPGDIRSNFTENRLKYADTNERYGKRVVGAQEKVDKREHKRMDVRKASKKISKIILKKKGALYIVGAKYKLLYFCSRVFSQNFMLKMTNKIFQPKEKN